MPSREAALRSLTQQVCRAANRARPSAGCVSRMTSLTLPGLLSDKVVGVHRVADLLVPAVRLPVAERADAIWGVLPYIGSRAVNNEARSAIATAVGRQVMDFTLCESTAEGRLVRLLWALSQDLEREVGPSTLVALAHSGEFGIRDQTLVGGPYAGVPIALPVSTFLARERVVRTRSTKLAELHRILHKRTNSGAYDAFCTLYAIAEWDTSVPLTSLLLPSPKSAGLKIGALAASILTEAEPYQYLHRTLVPTFLTYSDFINLFGNPERRGCLQLRARIRLINKTYMLPILE